MLYSFRKAKKEIKRLCIEEKYQEACVLIENLEFTNKKEEMKFIYSNITEQMYETFPEFFTKL